MTNSNQIQIQKDMAGKTLTINRHFNGSPEDVWAAWTESDLLDQWWAPKPWRAETKSMNFTTGGAWLYAMVGPDGTRHWSRVDYTSVSPITGFSGLDCFTDDEGNPNPGFPRTKWEVTFTPTATGTNVQIITTYSSTEDLQKIVEMGFEAGITMTMSNLDHYLATGFKLRKEMKTSNKPRVATYLNFNGNTEEAMNFYNDVFHGTFTGRGMQRFGDVTMPAGAPPMSDADKKLIIHCELTILGGHVLMATDAPESMGFKLQSGNNMHINLEPESREETERLFKALSEGGKVIMPLADMFFGAYFGQLTDKYGINWMLTFQEAH